MSSIMTDGLWFVKRGWVVFYLTLFTFLENQASFEDMRYESANYRHIDATPKKNKITFKANFQQCEIIYYRRNVCKVTEIFIGSVAHETRTEPKATRYHSGIFNESVAIDEIHLENSFETAKEAREKSGMKHNVEERSQSYSENIDEFDKLRKSDLESKVKFPTEEACPHLSIWVESNEVTADDNITSCNTSKLNTNYCQLMNAYLGKPREVLPRSCPQRTTTKNLCWFERKYRSSIVDMAGLQCDTGICRDNAVYLGVFNITLGRVMPDDDWRRLANGNALVEAVRDIMKKDYSNHFSFCFLRCFLKNHTSSTTKQILIFPPIVHHCPNTSSAPRISVNVIVEDSVSRPQFYRSLPKTVNNLRQIVHDSRIDATVLDFEKYQSYDSSTHSNIKKLFAGKNENGNFSDVSRAVSELYKRFTKASYKTLFQEDACWFEGFGSLLRPSFLKNASKNQTYDLWERFYRHFKGNLTPNIEHFGVGFSSCKILQDLGDANIFNGETLPALCFDGRPLSYYYLNVVQDLFDAYKGSSCPVFSYLHLNTGHEHTGQRISQDDEYLAGFLKTMAKHHGATLTIVLSDHGAKASEYATRTVQGLKEIYKPFMFIIIPRQAAKILGNERMRNLITNQKRLVALEDLNLALGEVARGFVAPGIGKGLFREISRKRNCTELKLSADAVCLCEEEEVETQMDPLFLDFLASIAVGGLNNRIQSQYSGETLNEVAWHSEYVDIESKSYKGKSPYVGDTKVIQGESLAGYGNCLRYVFNRVERLRSKVVSEQRITTFSVIVNTIPAFQEGQEIFEATFGQHLTGTNDVRLLKVTRLSRYSIYKTCADHKVQLELCTCAPNSQPDPKNYTWDLLGYYMFTRPSNIEKLEFPCLYLISTKRERFLKSGRGRDGFLAYEIVNSCDRIFKVTLLESSLVRKPFILSRPLPFSIIVRPNSAHYVVSAFCGLPDGEFVASFEVDVVEST